MKTATLHRALICGACSWLVWATQAEARFLQVDPIGYQDQVNLYAYVGNDPLNYFDPGGTESRVTPNGIVIIPSRVGIPSVTIPRVQGAEGINYFRTGVTHLYKLTSNIALG